MIWSVSSFVERLFCCRFVYYMPVTWTQVAGRNRWVAVVTTIIFYTELQYRRKTWDLQRKTCSRRWNFEGGTCSFRNFVSFSKLCNVQEWKCIYCLISISKFQVLIIFAGCFLSSTVLCCAVLSWYTRKIQLYCEYNPVGCSMYSTYIGGCPPDTCTDQQILQTWQVEDSLTQQVVV